MRDIKFRQFLGEGLGFHYFGYINGTFCGPIHPQKEAEQYTGRKDCVGKEIYEGDILQCWTEDGGAYADKGKIEVKYDNNWTSFTDGCYLLEHYERVKILGNIYENSNLLKLNPKENQ